MRKKILISGIIILLISIFIFLSNNQIRTWFGCEDSGLSLFFRLSKCKFLDTLPQIEGLFSATGIILIIYGIDFDSFIKIGGKK